MTMQQEIQDVIDRFHRKTEKDPQLKQEIAHLEKTFNINLGEETYNLELKNSAICRFEPGLAENADITVTTTPEHLRGLIEGTLRPMRAYVTKKVKIKGKLDDLMFLKKFFR